MSGNPLVIDAVLTSQQREAFDRLKARTHTVTDGAMIKKVLEQMIDGIARADAAVKKIEASRPSTPSSLLPGERE